MRPRWADYVGGFPDSDNIRDTSASSVEALVLWAAGCPRISLHPV